MLRHVGLHYVVMHVYAVSYLIHHTSYVMYIYIYIYIYIYTCVYIYIYTYIYIYIYIIYDISYIIYDKTLQYSVS